MAFLERASSPSFPVRLSAAAERADSLLCLELELQPDLLLLLGGDPLEAGERLLTGVLEALEQEGLFPAALRPLLGSFEAMGVEGVPMLHRVLAPWRDRALLLMDARFGETSREGRAASRAIFDRWGADGAILNPWSGWDFLSPFLERVPDRGVYFLLRPPARHGTWSLADMPVEEHSGLSHPAWMAVARQMREWGRLGLGAVVGSPFLGDLAQTASVLNREQPMPLLVTGAGERGGDAAGAAEALRMSGGDPRLFRVGVGESLLYAFADGGDRDPVAAAVQSARRLSRALGLSTPGPERREGPVRVFLVEDHDLVRRAFRSMLEQEADLVVTGDVGTGEEALVRLGETNTDVVLLDLGLPGMSGLEATRRLRATGCPARVVILSASEDFEDLIACLRAGAHGYIHKRIHAQELVDSVRRAARGEPVIPRDMIAPYLDFRAREKRAALPLSEREIQVLALLAEGCTNREISRRLDVAEGTIKSHVRSLFRKLNTSTREEAVEHARRHGLLGN